MKKYTLLISLFTLLTTMTAQESYRSIFGEKTTSFNVLTSMIDGNDDTDSFYYARDTILNDVLYKLFYWTKPHWPNNNNDSLNGLYLLRENEDRSKVFLRTINGELPYGVEDESKEYLIMDLNLNVQDTFVIRVNENDKHDSALLIVDNVYFDDEGRKHIQFNHAIFMTSTPFEFIEGVGTNMGPFYMGGGISRFVRNSGYMMAYLLCAFQDDQNIYTPTDYLWLPYPNMCSYFSVGIIEKEKDVLTIYPNPAQNYITIELGDNYYDYQSVTVFDLLGREKMNISVTQSRQTISTQSLQNGYYLIRINSDKENSLHKKLLIIK